MRKKLVLIFSFIFVSFFLMACTMAEENEIKTDIQKETGLEQKAEKQTDTNNKNKTDGQKIQNESNQNDGQKLQNENQQDKKVKPQSMKITLTGDTSVATFFGQRTYFEDIYRQKGAGYFLKNLEPYFKWADINITNLENVFTSSNVPIKGKIYTYKAFSDDYIDILLHNNIKYVNVVNNHMQDYLQKGFDDTLALLDKKGIKYFGTNLMDCADPELGSVKVHKLETFTKGDIKLGLAGYYAFVSTYPTDDIIKKDFEELKKQGCNFIIVSMHGGGQEDNIVLKRQEEMARKFIDFGADMVYGQHPHAIQRIEDYKGKKIYYSLGNFFFINYRSSKNPEAVLVKLTLNMDENKKITPVYENVPILWMGSRSGQKYTPTVATDEYTVNRVKNLLAGV